MGKIGKANVINTSTLRLFQGSLLFVIFFQELFYQAYVHNFSIVYFLLHFYIFACLSADEIMATLMPIIQSIRENQSFSTSGIGFLHPITDGRVTLSAHGCASHSWSRKISAPSRLSFTSGSSTPTGYSTLPRVFGLL